MRPVDELRKELDADMEARRRQLQRSWAREAFPGTAGGAALTAAPVAQETTRVPAVVASRGRFGAHIHVYRASLQPLAPGTTAIEWTAHNPGHQKANFPDITFPASEIGIEKTGYYDLQPEVTLDTVVTGAELSITRTRDGTETTVWPLTSAPGTWIVPYATRRFVGVAKGIELRPDDIITVYVTHAEPAAVDLTEASFTAELVDRTQLTGQWDLVFAADNWGVTHDDSEWWTTLGQGPGKDNVDPALFERAFDGTILNSYDGYDTQDPARNRGLIYAGGFLWGTGNAETVSKIDPADGTVVSTFNCVTTNPDNSRAGIAYDGTNLFVVENKDRNQVEEYTTGGSHVQDHPHPSGRSLRGLTWDGTGWWATTSDQDIVRLDATFTVQQSITGPTSDNRGLHWQDGILYVMTADGLYQRAV